MIESVTMTDATWAPAPRKFEPGVPNMAQIVGLGTALNYLTAIGMQKIHNHEIAVTEYAISKLLEIEELKMVDYDKVERYDPVFFNKQFSFIVHLEISFNNKHQSVLE
jgi:selenocysteine lyase/cysteine desulfurase